MQVIKGWLGRDGQAHERIYDIAWTHEADVDPATGVRPPQPGTVDTEVARYDNSIGKPELAALWEDPDFDAALPAWYLVRVLQIPTPRWTTYRAVAEGVEPPAGIPTAIRERAWSSPIWYTPGD